MLALLLGFGTAIDDPARQSFVIEMVGRDDLPNAVGLNSASFNLGRVIGPAVAGLLIEVVRHRPGVPASTGCSFARRHLRADADARAELSPRRGRVAARGSSSRASGTCGGGPTC